MKVLVTLRQPLFPADTGGKIRSLNIFSRLSKRVEMHVVSYADPLTNAAAITEMKAMFAHYTPVPWREAEKYSPTFYRQVLANQFSSLPYFLAKCNRPELTSSVGNLLARNGYDILFCDFLHTAVPFLTSRFRPRIVFEHNVEFLLRKRKWRIEKHPLRKLILNTEWRRTRTVEGKVCRSFSHIVTVSKADQQTLHDEFGIDNVSTIPAAVDTEFFRPTEGRPQSGRMVFVGSMDWEPNEDGIVWFLSEVYPRIRRAVPDASCSIVGRSPSSRLKAIAARTPAVDLAGWVPDVRPYLAQSEVVVVPLRIGGGTRIKIPEAMAMAKAVVSTPIGAEGLPFRDGRELRIADHPQDFAQAVVELLTNAPIRESIATVAREEVVRKHSWEVVVDRVEEILEQVMRRGKSATVA